MAGGPPEKGGAMTTGTILDEIVAHKRGEIERRRRALPLEAVQAAAQQAPPARDLAAALRRPGVSLVAEIKRTSPSKGPLRPDLDPVALARAYEAHGAAAISVLTDGRFFGGSLADLAAVRESIDLPILCKDFLLDPYQVYEARVAGADAVLLIVAALDDGALRDLYRLAGDLGMAALVEVHDAGELVRALALRPAIVGVNNRDLRTFEVDLETTARLRPLVPQGTLLVAESGVRDRADVERVSAIGADAALVGEALVRAADPGARVRELLGGERAGDLIRVKICGLTELEDAVCAAEAGADLLGFVFYQKSPRFVEPECVAAISGAIRRQFGAGVPRLVGVFVDEPPARVGEILEISGLDLAQLHGHETPEEVRALAPRAFKAIRPGGNGRQGVEAGAEAYYAAAAVRDPAPQLLVDAYHPQHLGGSGTVADLEAARRLARQCRLLLAGGLTPETVAAAVERVQPWGVDVSSGVELSPGRKDHGRVCAFVEAARQGGGGR